MALHLTTIRQRLHRVHAVTVPVGVPRAVETALRLAPPVQFWELDAHGTPVRRFLSVKGDEPPSAWLTRASARRSRHRRFVHRPH